MTDDARKPSTPEFFDQAIADRYDDKNRKLAAIAECMHFPARLILAEAPARARILCVEVGTGAEILSLASAHSEWRFVGVDPSAEMLGACSEKLRQANLLERCELIHGYLDDAPAGAAFDAVLSILVAHFIGREDRSGYYRAIHDRLKPGGRFVSIEISYDLDSAEFPAMLKNWERVQILMGASADSLPSLPSTLRDPLCVLTPADAEARMRAAGFALPAQFFQAFLVRGWHATK